MSLYEHLGLQKGADSGEIRRAYLRLSKTEHPDKGGSEERFKKIQEAYEILSDDEKKSFYDQTGQIPGQEQQMQGGGGGGFPGGFPFDLGGLFGGMFGGGMPGMNFGGGQRPQQMRRPKGPPKIHEIGLTLHDLFYGKKSQLKFQRQKFCDGCKGQGSTSFSQCRSCNGTGVTETRVMFGPGIQAIQRGPCGPCSGDGKQPDGTCGSCSGMKFKMHEKILGITIEPGMKSGDVIEFHNECSDQHEYDTPGDVHIVIRENDDTLNLTRMGDDLSTVLNISLADAILGCQRSINGHPAHPGGLTVTIPQGTMRGDVVTITGEGMPRRGTTQRGNLQLTMIVDVNAKEKELLSKHNQLLRTVFT
jgi:DnaJ-class molecular chaperone